MATVKELTEQNGYLVAQLEQVQQDLERYYIENLQLLQNSNGIPFMDETTGRFWLKFHPREFWIDLREETLHDNWYESERRGRWAGPKPVTTFTIPPLRAGEYIAQFEIIDFVAREILDSIVCKVGGVVVQPQFEYLYPPSGLPLVLGLPFRANSEAQPRSLDIQLEFSKSVSPHEMVGSDDLRRLTACFRTIRIVDAQILLG